jgi:hypothetical protein
LPGWCSVGVESVGEMLLPLVVVLVALMKVIRVGCS